MKPGFVLWITGLSGAGKTTVASHLQDALLGAGVQALLLDGDALRSAVAEDLGYGKEDRLRAAMRYSRLCRLLSEQGINVICSTISMFRDCRAWNRTHISRYMEVYLRVPMTELIGRDAKGLYLDREGGPADQMVGRGIDFEEPDSADLTVDNFGPTAVQDAVRAILASFFDQRTQP